MRLIYFISLIITLFVIGCGTIPPTRQKAIINERKIESVSQLSYGVGVALNHTNVPIAKELNTKVISIVGIPSVENIKKIEDAVSVTNTTFLDTNIQSLQIEEVKVNKEIEKQADSAIELKKELAEYESWWGLGGVWKGLTHFATNSFYLIIAFVIIFFILRVFATVNPIAGAFFSIFQGIGSACIHCIEALLPKVKNTTTNVLSKVVDAVEANKDAHIIKDQLTKVMTPTEKQLIKDVKKDLHYDV